MIYYLSVYHYLNMWNVHLHYCSLQGMINCVCSSINAACYFTQHNVVCLSENAPWVQWWASWLGSAGQAVLGTDRPIKTESGGICLVLANDLSLLVTGLAVPPRSSLGRDLIQLEPSGLVSPCNKNNKVKLKEPVVLALANVGKVYSRQTKPAQWQIWEVHGVI